ncbi:MAG TPA: alpha-E domain-containing protein [Aliidongia sp.]|nr:alpha-E domain-containing protein [Aliidongia sp.]
MLSRTADSLFWLARYIERAENVARLVMVGHRMASMAKSLENPGNEWHSTLLATGCQPGFFAKHGEATAAAAIDYLVRDPDNPSSIFSCLDTARRNARAVRTALTVDMWDALNETWLRTHGIDRGLFEPDRLIELLEWVKERSLLFNGAYANTMLRNDAFYFTRLGTFVERADNTARILDVKYHVLLPRDESVGGALDYYHWQAMLRSVSALRSYHWVYQERLKPWLVAELLILRPEMPRSLLSCYDQIVNNLELLAEAYGGKRGECHRIAGELHARLRYGRIRDIFQAGLHEFLIDFIDRSATLGSEISRLYLM